MRIFLATLALILLAAPAHAVWSIDPDFKFKIDAPSNWKRNVFMDDKDKVYAFISPQENAVVRVRAFVMTKPLTPDELGDLFESRILPLRIKDISRFTRQNTDLNGIPGAASAFHATFDNIPVTIAAFYTIQNQIAYIVWFTIPTAHQDTLGNIVDSITSTFTIIP